jgi:hypothetical protein
MYLTDYSIIVEAMLTGSASKASSISKIKVSTLRSKIIGMIVNGNKMEAFGNDFYVEGQAKDPDYNITWNIDIRLQKNWACTNMNDN